MAGGRSLEAARVRRLRRRREGGGGAGGAGGRDGGRRRRRGGACSGARKERREPDAGHVRRGGDDVGIAGGDCDLFRDGDGCGVCDVCGVMRCASAASATSARAAGRCGGDSSLCLGSADHARRCARRQRRCKRAPRAWSARWRSRGSVPRRLSICRVRGHRQRRARHPGAGGAASGTVQRCGRRATPAAPPVAAAQRRGATARSRAMAPAPARLEAADRRGLRHRRARPRRHRRAAAAAPATGTIGLGNLGTIGYGGGTGTGYGYGSGVGGLGGRRASARLHPRARRSRAARCDKELIRRVVRAHLNELRFCYERALQSRPTLAGRVVSRFLIELRRPRLRRRPSRRPALPGRRSAPASRTRHPPAGSFVPRCVGAESATRSSSTRLLVALLDEVALAARRAAASANRSRRSTCRPDGNCVAIAHRACAQPAATSRCRARRAEERREVGVVEHVVVEHLRSWRRPLWRARSRRPPRRSARATPAPAHDPSQCSEFVLLARDSPVAACSAASNSPASVSTAARDFRIVSHIPQSRKLMNCRSSPIVVAVRRATGESPPAGRRGSCRSRAPARPESAPAP